MQGISFIIVNYHASHLVEKLISSLNIVDEETDTEVVVVDNTTEKHARFQFPENHVRIHYPNKNLGFGRACNVGAQLASKSNLVFLNPDSVFSQKDPIKRLNKLFSELPQNTIFTGRIFDRNQKPVCNTFRFSNFVNIVFQNSVGRVVGNSIPMLSNKVNVYTKNRSHEVDWVSGAFLCVNRSYFFEVGGFDEKIFMYEEDADLCYRAKKSGGKILFLPDVNIIHYGGASSKNNNELLTLIGLKSTLYFYRKRNNRVSSEILERLIPITWILIYYLHLIFLPVFPSTISHKIRFWKRLVNIVKKHGSVSQRELIKYF